MVIQKQFWRLIVLKDSKHKYVGYIRLFLVYYPYLTPFNKIVVQTNDGETFLLWHPINL